MKRLSSISALRSRRLLIAVPALCLLLSCKESLRPHQDAPGDTYCVYTITKVNGSGALKVGDTICIYCPPPATTRCASTKTVEVAEGIQYDLVSAGASCASCPGKNTYEKIP